MNIPFLDMESKVRETLELEDNEQKQIEEMAEEIIMAFEDVQSNCDCGDCIDCEYYHIEGRIGCKSYGMAKNLYISGYRMERQGEWIQHGLCNPKCSLCLSYNYEKSNYCPNCGAKMKGATDKQ